MTPISTTTRLDSSRYFEAVKDQMWMGHTLFDLGVAYDTVSQLNSPHGDATYMVSPSSNSGNYFQRTSRHSRRLQGVGNVTTGALNWFGEHTLSAGRMEYFRVWISHWQSTRSAIDYLRADGTLSEQAMFSGSGAVRLSALRRRSFYAQDHWRPFKTRNGVFSGRTARGLGPADPALAGWSRGVKP